VSASSKSRLASHSARTSTKPRAAVRRADSPPKSSAVAARRSLVRRPTRPARARPRRASDRCARSRTRAA
jgi:hypothetical protein